MVRAERQLFNALSDKVDAAIAPVRTRYGVTDEWLERAYAESMRQAEDWSPDDPSWP